MRRTLYDLIFVSLEPWDEVWRRNQFFCAAMARRHPERRILFVEPPVDLSAAVRRRRVDEMRGAGTRQVESASNITVTRPRKWLPNKTAATRRFNEAGFRRHVQLTARQLGFYANGRRPLLWLNPHTAVHMAGAMDEAVVVYDVTDDWTLFDASGPLARRTLEQDRRLSERADAIIVCSEALRHTKAAHHEKLHLIRNGVDCDHYAAVRDGGSAPEGPQPRERPVLGYTGTVHADRLDVDLLVRVAESMEHGTIELIGPDHLSHVDRTRLRATGRVWIRGAVSYHDLPDHMRQFDVCIVPHRVTPFTESLNPIKLWEYLAAGKPIVATPVAGFRDFAAHVRLASNADDFLAAVTAAAGESPDAADRRQALAEQHSWRRRVDAVEAVLAEVASKADGAKIAEARAQTVSAMSEPTPSQCEVSVLIVSFNTRQMTLQCLDDLQSALANLAGEVIVVDNASTDGSAAAIRERFPHITLIASDTNLGFGAANNLAMRHARGRYWMLLNSDAFVTSQTITTLIAVLEARPNVGLLGPKLLNSDGSTQRSCFRYPSPARAWLENLGVPKLLKPRARLGDYRQWAHDEAGAVDWVVGACQMVRAEAAREIGGFDERFFMYAEETDWQKRIRDRGWEIYFTPETTVTHWGGASGAGEQARVNRHFFESLDRYQHKHHGRAGLVAVRLAMVSGALLRLPAWAALYVSRPSRRERAHAKLVHYRWLIVRQLGRWPSTDQEQRG